MVIVANAPEQHEQTAARCISAGIPTLVEKPFTLSAHSSERLIRLSEQTKVQLFTAHVFMFSGYLECFSKSLPPLNTIETIHIDWTDPQNELRHGQQKYFDSSLPIIIDVLPHIVSILTYLLPSLKISFRELQLDHGGAWADLLLQVGDIRCTVRLCREYTSRQRIIKISTPDNLLEIDFSKEPGTISDRSTRRAGDPDWHNKLRPLGAMLKSFINCASHGLFDPRLNPSIGLMSNKLCDEVLPAYKKAQVDWLVTYLSDSNLYITEEFRYALTEVLKSKVTISEDLLQQHYVNLRNILFNDERSSRMKNINSSLVWQELANLLIQHHSTISKT